MKIIRVIGGAGVVLVAAAIIRTGLATTLGGHVGTAWLVAFAVGVLCIAVAAAYAAGYTDGAAAEAAWWRRRRIASPGLATRSPAAGRPGASLPTVDGIAGCGEPDRRVDGEAAP